MLLQKSKLYEKEIFNVDVTKNINYFILHNNCSYVFFFLKEHIHHEEIYKMLTLATEHAHKRIIDILVQKNNCYIQPTIQAAKSGHAHLVDFYQKKYDERYEKSHNFSQYVIEGAVSGKRYNILEYIIDEYCADKGFEEACFIGDRKLIKYLIKNHGCDYWDEGLNSAAAGGHLDIVKYFVNKYDMNSRDMCDAIASCVEGSRSQEVIDYIISKRPDNYQDALWEAAKKGYMDLVKLFVSLGEDSWQDGYDGAVLGRHQDIIEFFEKKMKNN